LLSLLLKDNEPNNKYHKSNWLDTDRKITKAKDLGLVNPFSLHPTEDSHKIIAGLFENEIDFTTGERR
jgi:hypothetical protein